MKSSPLGNGQRAASRYEAPDEFMVEFLNVKRGTPGVGYGRDLSSNGMRFSTPTRMKAGQDLEMTLHFPAAFPGAKQVALKAKVIRVYLPKGSNHYRVGCELIFSDDRMREAVHQFLYWLNVKEF